jgi:phosphonate transport system permease protein
MLLGLRRPVLLVIAAAGVWAYLELDLTPASVIPSFDDLRVFGRFVAHAFSPSFEYEAEVVPAGTPTIFAKALEGARLTVVYAAAAMSLAIPIGAVLGFFASTAWWSDETIPGRGVLRTAMRRTLAPLVYAFARVLIVLMRSVHELLWAVIFLSAVGLSSFSAVFAITIPFAGTLAKVFSEIIDEAPRDAADALRGLGASAPQVLLFGLGWRALPDIGAYSFYRFECALRSSAILGFFGPETLGKFIRLAWNENHYGEVWTYLYTLFALILLADWWSGVLRRRYAA